MTRKLLRILGPVLFLVILSRMDLARMTEIVRAIRLHYLVAAMLLYPCLILLKAWRWRMLLRRQQINYGLAAAFLAYNSSLGVGYVTPGRLGEFVKALYLQRDEDVPLGHALSSVVLDRLLDLYLLLVTAGLGIAALSLPGQLSAIAAGVFATLGLAPLIVLVPSVSRRIIVLIVKGLRLTGMTRYRSELEQTMHRFQHGMEQLLHIHLLLPLLVTVAAYALFYFQCHLTALALRLPLSYWYVAFCVSLASLLALVPVSVSGLGVRDATFIALLRPLGLSAEMAISYSLLILLVFNIWGGALGAISWLAKPLR